ncbi:uncharacterized protein IL334_007287 [Kwoniella shivajii]|uniref:NmrA-like domain-containing protein n=1 Tax=Kwoniella shivajii TaxID=564305 RepID=A0ABZ1DA44_9TREE|nr:hypothetical protein IL334_007287 [Kwoniella shivajii]
MSSVKNIIVFGSTGQQGSAFIEGLSKYNTPSSIYNIFALSRNVTAGSSTRLSNLPGVKVIQVAKNYMDKPEQAFESTGLNVSDVHGVFNVQGYVSEAVELAQAKSIIDVSKKYGVKHFIQSSISFGGLEDTKAPGMEVKRQIEDYLIESGIGYTILRPTQFMDNLLPSSAFMFKISRTMLIRQTFYNNPSRKHQLISTRDIGHSGSESIHNPSKYLNRIIELAGDELTVQEIQDVYEKIMDKPIDLLAFWPLVSFVKWVSPLGPMSRFFDDHGFKVDIPKLREDLPEVEFEDLASFLKRYKASH